MTQSAHNAQRLLHLFDQLRDQRLGVTAGRLREHQLSLTHLRTLRLLAAAPALAMKELAEQLALTPPSVTTLTRRLVQLGLIQREAHAEDSRVALLSLTSAGQSLLEEISRVQLDQMELLLQGMLPAEQVQFLELLERAVCAIQTEASV